MVGEWVRRVGSAAAIGGVLLAGTTGLSACAWTPEPTETAETPGYGSDGPLPSEDAEVVAEADSGQPPATLHAIDVTSLAEVERVTLEFEGSFDGYTVGYVKDLKKQISSGDLALPTGTPTPPPGAAVLRIRVENAKQGTPAIRSVGGLGAIAGHSVVGSDGTTLTVALGTTSRLPFVVMEQADPARLVVNVKKPVTGSPSSSE